MKRLRVILLFLLLGAMVNIAVAWGCSLLINIYAFEIITIRTENSSTDSWELSLWEAPGSTLFGSIRAKGEFDESMQIFRTQQPISSILPNWGDLYSQSSIFPEVPGDQIFIEGRTIEGRGWPLRTVWCDYGFISDDAQGISYLFPGSRRGMIETPLPVWELSGYPRVLPYLPIWCGIAINTIFYAAILWLLFPGKFALRRIIRRKRGLCVKCAYDLRGVEHEACPECGTDVRKVGVS